jgi:hypothetical protein
LLLVLPAFLAFPVFHVLMAVPRDVGGLRSSYRPP